MSDQPKPTTMKETNPLRKWSKENRASARTRKGQECSVCNVIGGHDSTKHDQPKPTTGERPPPLSVGWHKMKEQERATTGEWTAEALRAEWNGGGGTLDDFFDKISKRHNAALTTRTRQ